MRKPSGFEVMQFILYIRVWLHQRVPVEQPLKQGYGRCCRMTGGDSQNPGGSTPILDEVADSTGDTGQRKMRSQPRGASSSGAAQSIPATIDHMSLATATSQMNVNSAGNLTA